MPTPMPARMPATISGPTTGVTDCTSVPIVWSRRPSRMSLAASTTIPWNQYVVIATAAALIPRPTKVTPPA